MKFTELNLEESVLQALDAMRFEECTPIQEHTIPVILEGFEPCFVVFLVDEFFIENIITRKLLVVFLN